MSKPKTLLINAITLLCLEHREGVATSPSVTLIKDILDSLPVPESTVDFDHGRQVFLELRGLVIWLNSRDEESFPSETELLQQVQVACREETYLYEALLNVLKEKYEAISTIVKLIQSYRIKLEKHLKDEKVLSIINKLNYRITFKRDTVHDVLDEIRATVAEITPMLDRQGSTKHPAQIGSLDFSDSESLHAGFTDVKTTLSTEGAFQTGWKGFNRMLGRTGAIKRGEFAIMAALQHQFKSGLMLELFCHFCLFNKPFMRDPTRRPLILFITFENEAPDNLLTIYKYLRENETGEAVVESEIDPHEASDYVMEQLRATGFETQMVRFDPSDFTYASLIGYLEGIMADGFEIQMLIVDYLNMMSKSGIDYQVAGDDIRLLFRRVRNFTSARGISFITPHQLSSEAMMLTRENVEDFVTTVAGKGYYDGCKRLGQEPDLEVFVHTVMENGLKYLAVARGKHRNNVTAMEYQSFFMQFHAVGTLPWDIDKDNVDYTLSRPGGGNYGSGEETPWWEQ